MRGGLLQNKLFIFTVLVVIAVVSRFIPHPLNFSPIGALALFAGAFIREKKWAAVIPLAAMLVSDLFIGLHSTMIFVYGAFAVIAWTGVTLKEKRTVLRVGGLAVSAAFIFFVVTNLGVWLMTPMYEPTVSGFIACFAAAVPFFHNTLAGNLVYSALLFGVYEWLLSYKPRQAYSS